MTIPRLLMLVFTGVFLSVVLNAQTPAYYHYTSSDGLASSTVFQIVQGRDGFIWFATLNGMSRFDGERFTTFHTTEGLNSNAIITIAEGRQGELYIGNYEKGINVFRNGRIEDYCSTIDGKSFAISYFLVDSLGNDEQILYAYRRMGEINSIHEKKGMPISCRVFSSPSNHINRLDLLPNGKLVVLSESGLYHFDQNKLSKINISGLPDTNLLVMAKGIDSTYLIGTSGMIYQIKNEKVIRKIDIQVAGNNDVCAMLTDKKNNIWFSIMNSGFYFIPNGSDEIIDIGKTMGLKQTLVNNYLEDNEGNIWISTFGKGVYCLNNLYLKNYNENDGLSNNNIYAIAKEKSGKLLIGTFNDINVLENGKFDQIKGNTGKTLTEVIYSIRNINNDIYVCGNFGGNKDIQLEYKGIRFYLLNKPSFSKTENGLHIFGTHINSIAVQQTLIPEQEVLAHFILFGDSANINRVNDIYEDSENKIWIATGLGLCKALFKPNILGKLEMTKSFFSDNDVLGSRINSIFEDGNKQIWFAGEKGIARYYPENDSVVSYASLDDYDLSSSTTIVADKQNRIWVGNMKGLYLLENNSVKYLNQQTGLPSNEVLSLFYDSTNNSLLIGTSNGMSILDIDNFDHYQPLTPKVVITEVKAGDSIYTNYDNLIFKPEQHDISITFQAIHFSSPGSVTYKYSLNNDWQTTDYNSINFASLKNGTYNLQIIAKAQNTMWSEPYVLTFTVPPRFTETIWFYLLMIFLLLTTGPSILMLSLKLKTIKANKELALTERINELKHQALSAMMNPHFIANSLNSVQYLVNSRKYEDANNYIAMIAKLMRKNLDTAGKGFISLSDEIDRLKLYLDIEKLRFQESFTYEIIVGSDLEANSILIPNMIIQPFVENSIWHGIINSGNSGKLTVAFTFENVEIDSLISQSLIIRVTDNGIGINEAKKHKKEDHISKGIQIIEERLRLLSTKMNLTQPIVFEDLSITDPEAHGTEVIISLPPPLYKVTNHRIDSSASFTV